MNEEHEIQIVEGEEAQEGLPDRDLIHLTNRVNKLEHGDVVGQLRHRIAIRIHRLLLPENVKRSLMRNVDPAFNFIEHMKYLRENGQIALAKDGKKTVGMVGFEYCGHDAVSERAIYEIRRIAIRKEYEGRGIGSQLHRKMFERVQLVDPRALILVETQHPSVVQQCRAMGYKPCSIQEGLHLKYGVEADTWLPLYEKAGSTFFLYDRESQ